MGKTRFAKGQSGNPAGKPLFLGIFRGRARELADKHVLEAWAEEVVTRGKDWLEASKCLAAYGYGKPTQPVSGEDGGPVEVNARVIVLPPKDDVR